MASRSWSARRSGAARSCTPGSACGRRASCSTAASAVEIQADRVVLAGGAIGTPGLLMRSRGFLPNLSDEVGRHLSANGDLALMAILPRDRRLPGRGRLSQQQGVAMDTVCYE